VSAHQVVDDTPHFANVLTDAHHELTVGRVSQASDALVVLVFDLGVVKELCLVKLHHIEDLLGRLELSALLQVLHAILSSHHSFSASNVLLEDAHTLFALTHRDEQVRVQSLALALDAENELIHLLEQLLVANAACAPPVHAEVALGVKMAIGQDTSLAPVVQSFTLFVVEKSHDALLVVHIGLLAHEGRLHLVDRLLEELFVLSDQQFFYTLQATLALRDGVNLNAFDQHLNQGGRLGELSPGQRQTIQRNRESLLGRSADHKLEDCNAQRVDIFEHDDFHFLAIRNLLLLLREGPVAGLGAKRLLE